MQKAADDLYLLTHNADTCIAFLKSHISLLHFNNQFKVQILKIEILHSSPTWHNDHYFQ